MNENHGSLKTFILSNGIISNTDEVSEQTGIGVDMDSESVRLHSLSDGNTRVNMADVQLSDILAIKHKYYELYGDRPFKMFNGDEYFGIQ